ncbi:hypothetical protein ACTXT7_006207 [Hymenolepis weldensis]
MIIHYASLQIPYVSSASSLSLLKSMTHASYSNPKKLKEIADSIDCTDYLEEEFPRNPGESFILERKLATKKSQKKGPENESNKTEYEEKINNWYSIKSRCQEFWPKQLLVFCSRTVISCKPLIVTPTPTVFYYYHEYTFAVSLRRTSKLQ